MDVKITPYLRNALNADAAVSGAAGLVMAAGAGLLSPVLALPSGLLVWAGVALAPFVVLLLVVASRSKAPAAIMVVIIAINVLWVFGSVALLMSSAVSPNVLGMVFVATQAIAVALFAQLQFVGYRRARGA
ncbi:MAG: hypothetical protein AB7I79_07135 [Rhizobiaceae bacterium]